MKPISRYAVAAVLSVLSLVFSTSLYAAPALTLTCANAVSEVGVPYSSAYVASGGVAPYTFSINSGTLPPGLMLDTATGALTGTPTAAANFNDHVKVVDSAGHSVIDKCAIKVAQHVVINCLPQVKAVVGQPYSGTFPVHGGVAPLTFSIISGSLPPGLTLDPSTGIVSGIPTTSGRFNYTVQVEDSLGAIAIRNCGITITQGVSLLCASSTGEVGVAYSSKLIAAGGKPPYTFSIATGSLPPGLTLNPTTGAITGTPTTAGTFNFTAQVVDSTGTTAGTQTANCSIVINPPPSANCVVINAEQGVPITPVTLVGTGGAGGPYTFTATGLPSGLTISSSGTISGTPTVSGTFNYKVTITDVNGNKGTINCSVTVIPPPQLTCLSTGTIGEVGAPFSSGALTVTGGTAPYTFSIVGTLPAGLTLNTATGAVTGTPTAAGSFAIQVTDALGVTATTTCPYTIIGGPQLTCLATGTTGEVGAPFSSGALTVTGGTAPYTFSIVGTLPAGLTLNTATGAVTGTPTAAGSFSIQVTDAKGVTATTTCPYTIIGGPQLTCLATGTTGEVGAPFNSGALTVTGGTTPYTFSIVGTLPAGLTLNTATGAVTGTPTAAGSFSIQVTDAKGVTATTTCPYTITPGPQVNCSATNTTGEVGAAFNSGPITVIGGTTPYTFSIVGTLPAGLTLNTATGVVTGTPSAAGSFSIQVTDAKGVVGNATCPFTIIPGPQVNCSATNTTGEVGAAFSSGPITVTGGTAPYTFSIVGTLPAGLTLNTSTGVVTGTPTAAGTFSIQVTDADGVVGNTTCPFTIIGGPQLTCLSTGTTGEVGAPFSSGPLTVTGGTAPYTFSVVGTLPAGLTLNTATGAVTGTPTAIGTFSIQVTDAKGVTATTTCPYTIITLPGLTCLASGTTGEVGAPFSSGALTVTGGTTPYTFSIVGTLPAGLTLNTATGAVTGTPTAAGSFSIQVTDAKGVTATTTCPYTIIGGPQLTCLATGTTGEVGAPFSSGALTVTGGTTPYTFSVVGTLPAGLTLNTATGAVTGTPTAAGTFSIQVTDAKGVTATTTCPYTIIGGPQLTCLSTGTTGEVGALFNSGPLTVTGGTTPYTFSIVGTLPAGLTLNTATGAVTGTPTAAGSFSIQVTDAKGVTATATCPYTIIAGPQLTCLSTGTTGEVGAPFSSGALTVTGGTTPYTFSIVGTLPAGLTLNTSTGAVTGTPTAAGSFSIQVTDAKGVTATTTCPYTIIPGPQLTCLSTGTTGEVGAPFSSGALTVTGGTTPYTFSIVGTLPAGLTLNTATGAVTGTPTAAGTFSIQVTDAKGVTATTTCPYTIIPGPQLTCLSTGTTGEVGAPFSSGALTVTGGTAPYTFSIVGTLPAGLTLNTATGAITGTPTAAGSFSIQVTDAKGVTATTTCPYTIIPGPQLTCLSTGTTGEVGAPFNSGALTVTGGTTPYTFSIIGTLPAGLTLNTATGAVTGTPTAVGSFSIQVTDAKGVTATTTCPYTINPGPQLTCLATGTTGEVGAPFSSGALTVTGGTTPYTFSVVGTLPAGLTLNTATGAVTGTPTAAGSFSIQVTDALGVTATTTCPYTIIPPPQLTCLSTGTTGEVGAPFNSGALTVTGGTTPYTFSIVGTLPAGLTLNTTTGAVTGTPTAAGTFSIQVTDAKGVTATTTCPYTIIAGPLLTCSASSNTGEVGVSFNSGVPTVTGGTTPYTFSIVGTLPAGLTLNTTTGVVSGTPTAQGTFSIQVTDAKGVVATGTCPITINPPVIIVNPVGCSSSIFTGEVGVAFDSGPLTVTGGVAPYTFSIGSGTLPPGLTLNTSTGEVTGTPTAPGSFVIKVTDSLGATATGCPFTINPGISVTCSGTSTGTVGVPFNSGPITVTGGEPPYKFSIGSGTLPPGLTLNTTTGAVTGTPTAAGTFTINVTDSLGAVGTGCTITINAPACLASQLGAASGFSVLGLQGSNNQFSSGQTLVMGNVGIGVNGQLNFSGGGVVQGILFVDPTAQIQLSGGSQATGGEQTQSMTAIQNAVSAEATTVAALSPTQTLSQINGTTTITGSGGQNVILITGNVQLNGGQTITITGGPTDTFIFKVVGNFQLTGGSRILLSGVSPNQVLWYFPGNGGSIQTNGSSNTQGIFLAPNRQIQISGGVHISEFISGPGVTLQSGPTVKAFPPCGPGPVTLACPANTGLVGVPYDASLVASGGEPPYTFSITAGSLPPVLTLNSSTGEITGTPTTPGPFNFTAQVMDSSGQTAGTVADSCTITVAPNTNVCTIPPAGTEIGGGGTSWNQFNPVGSTDVVWVNMHIGMPAGVPTNTITTVQFTGVNFLLNGQTYPLPDGYLIFDPSAPATPTTTYDPTNGPNGAWTTIFNPNDLSDEIFFDGQAIPVDANIAGGGNADITYTTESNDNNLAFDWQWSAAVYTYWPDNNTANILPYHNSLHAGTPQNTQVQQSLIQGPRGGGGSNFTGSWSATGKGKCPGAQ